MTGWEGFRKCFCAGWGRSCGRRGRGPAPPGSAAGYLISLMPGPPTGLQRTAEDNLPTLSSLATEAGHDHLPFVSAPSPTASLKTISLPPSWEDAGPGAWEALACHLLASPMGPRTARWCLVPAPPAPQARLAAPSSEQLLSSHVPQTMPSRIRASTPLWVLPVQWRWGARAGQAAELSVFD